MRLLVASGIFTVDNDNEEGVYCMNPCPTSWWMVCRLPKDSKRSFGSPRQLWDSNCNAWVLWLIWGDSVNDLLLQCLWWWYTFARALVKVFPHIKCTVLADPKTISSKPFDGAINYVLWLKISMHEYVENMASYAISSSLILVIHDNMIIGTNDIVLACLCRHF
jgi:hypothetical protein